MVDRLNLAGRPDMGRVERVRDVLVPEVMVFLPGLVVGHVGSSDVG